jgi:hypothetical protein
MNSSPEDAQQGRDRAQSAQTSTESGFPGQPGGYVAGMSPLEHFIDEVEVSITDAVDAMDDEETARLYAEVLDVEQRLEALRDALTVLATARF